MKVFLSIPFLGHGRPNFLNGDNFKCLPFQNFLTLRRFNVLHYMLSNSSLLTLDYKFDTKSLSNYVISNDGNLHWVHFNFKHECRKLGPSNF